MKQRATNHPSPAGGSKARPAWLAACAAVVMLAAFSAACGGSSKKAATTTPVTPGTVTAGATKQATTSASAATKTNVTPAPTSGVATIVPVTVLANGTIVSGGTPITAEQATAISAQQTSVVAAATATAGPATTAVVTAPPGSTATPTATAVIPPTLPPAAGGTIAFESTAPINVATGADFDVNLIVSGVSERYQGYQWTIHDGPNVTLVRQTTSGGSGFSTCATPTNVGQNLTYGGCFSTGDTAPYNGRVETVTFHCDAPGALTLRFANVIESNNYGTSFLRTGGGGEFGGGSSDVVNVTCA